MTIPLPELVKKAKKEHKGVPYNELNVFEDEMGKFFFIRTNDPNSTLKNNLDSLINKGHEIVSSADLGI